MSILDKKFKDSVVSVDIQQPRVAHYRVPLYCELAKSKELDFFVQASNGQHLLPSPLKEQFSFEHSVIKFAGTGLIWQKSLKLVKAKGRGDVIVVCGDLHYLSTLVLVLKARLKRVGVVWWGHHVSANPRKWRLKLRFFITKMLSDVVLCYTSEGVDFYVKHGFSKDRVFSADNTIDQREIEHVKGNWDKEKLINFRTIHGLSNKKILLFSSVLRPKIKLELLFHALSCSVLSKHDFKLVIIGDGEASEQYKILSESSGITDKIIWLGTIFDEKVLAPWFLVADLFVYPGAIGLSLLHAFSYGLPVLTHNNVFNHGPEFNLMQPGVNGMVFAESDASDLAVKICDALDSPQVLMKMASNLRDNFCNKYTMQNMANNFIKAIQKASQVSLD